jgi:hypothetical protein
MKYYFLFSSLPLSSAELNATFDTPGQPYLPRGAKEELDAGMLHTARVYAAMIMSMDRSVV